MQCTPLATTSETLAVQCCVPSGLNFEAAGYSIVYMLLFVLLFASRELSHCKCDMGILSWLNAKLHERAPIPPPLTLGNLCKVLAWPMGTLSGALKV